MEVLEKIPTLFTVDCIFRKGIMENIHTYIEHRLIAIKSLTGMASEANKHGCDSDIIHKIYALAGEFVEELDPYKEEVLEHYIDAKDIDSVASLFDELLHIYKHHNNKCTCN